VLAAIYGPHEPSPGMKNQVWIGSTVYYL